MFTTEGHIVSVDKHLRESPWKEFFSEEGGQDQEGKSVHRPKSPDLKVINSSSNVSCFLQGWLACGGGENNTNLSSRVPDRKLVAHIDWVTGEEFHKRPLTVGTPGSGAAVHPSCRGSWSPEPGWREACWGRGLLAEASF